MRVGCKHLIYSVTDVWLEVNLHQDLSTLSDSYREVVEVQFHMFSISFEFHHFLALCMLRFIPHTYWDCTQLFWTLWL